MFFVELVQYVLRSLYGTGDQLGVKHDIQCIGPKFPFGFLISSVYLDGIAHGLECVKAQTDRKEDGQIGNRIGAAQGMDECSNVLIDEVVILKDRQYANVGYEAPGEEELFSGSLRIFDEYTCIIVNDDREEQDEYVDRLEEHIKKAILIQKGNPMPGKDIALLKIEDGNNLPMLTMSKDSIVHVGEQVLVYGFPEPVTSNVYLAAEASIEPTLTSGIVSAIKKSLAGWPKT